MNQTVTLPLAGLHCVSCALNIDNALEDLGGVVSSQTNYPKSLVKIEYNPQITPLVKLITTIKALGYDVLE